MDDWMVEWRRVNFDAAWAISDLHAVAMSVAMT
jgi:hypothetical protein